MEIVNLTQHPDTAEQLDAGVVDLPPEDAAFVRRLLTFDSLPESDTIRDRAAILATMAGQYAGAAMIGWAPYLMGPLERALWARGITAFYAFTLRQRLEERLVDGAVRGTTIFRHAGFVPAVLL